MPKWNDFGNIWNTLREIDTNSIREEAERPLAIACVGHESALDELDTLLRRGREHYPTSSPNPLELISIERAAERAGGLNNADMLIFAVDARRSLSPVEIESFGRLEALTIPFLVVVLHGDRLPAGDTTLSPMIRSRTIAIADPVALDTADKLATAVFARLPTELHLAAARSLPGLRGIFTRELIGSTSITNATYSLASGLPEQIPILSIPFAAADIIILTKNQALMVYRLALAYGAPPEFQARIREVLPVIGGAFLWRQAARSLVGLIPIWGLLPKIAIAYAGTYTTGVAAWRWFENGELLSTDQLKRISREAMAVGRARAVELIARARAVADSATTNASAGGGLFKRLKDALHIRRKPHQLNPPKQ